jgi:thiol-disulfide isomerase/thioredoxin
MAYTESIMMPLGTKAPNFTLPDTVSGTNLALQQIAGIEATVIMFLCNHCPYVLYINPEIVKIATEYSPKGVNFVGISSNDAENYPQDAPELMTDHAKEVGYDFPYLYDETQDVARAYDAVCTPEFYVFDADLCLIYRGQLDESRPKRNPVPSTGKDLRLALDAALAGLPVNPNQRPGGGCNIKWKVG